MHKLPSKFCRHSKLHSRWKCIFILTETKQNHLKTWTKPWTQQHADRFCLVVELNETHYKSPGGISIFFLYYIYVIHFLLLFPRQYNYYSMAFAFFCCCCTLGKKCMLQKYIFYLFCHCFQIQRGKRSPFSSLFRLVYINIIICNVDGKSYSKFLFPHHQQEIYCKIFSFHKRGSFHFI